MNKLGCDIKVMSIQVDKLSNMCIGFLTIWCKPICGGILSSFAPSKLLLL